MAEGIISAGNEGWIGLLAGLVVTCAVADEGIRSHDADGAATASPACKEDRCQARQHVYVLTALCPGLDLLVCWLCSNSVTFERVCAEGCALDAWNRYACGA